MVPFPRAECRSCRAPLSYFAPSCPQCGGSNQPNPVTIGAGLSGLLLLCAAILLAVQVVRHMVTGFGWFDPPHCGDEGLCAVAGFRLRKAPAPILTLALN